MDTIVERSKRKGLADISHIRLAKNSAVLLGTYIFAWLLQSRYVLDVRAFDHLSFMLTPLWSSVQQTLLSSAFGASFFR